MTKVRISLVDENGEGVDVRMLEGDLVLGVVRDNEVEESYTAMAGEGGERECAESLAFLICNVAAQGKVDVWGFMHKVTAEIAQIELDRIGESGIQELIDMLGWGGE